MNKLASPRNRVIAAIATLSMIAVAGAACAPIPTLPPPVTTPGANIYAPAIENGPAISSSPLQPTRAATSTVEVVGSAAVTPTLPPADTSTPVPPTATPAPTLAGPVWQWVSSTFKDGTVLAPSDPARYTFRLLGEGNALVQADCNFGTGSYEESPTNIVFTAIGTTKVACPPDSLDGAFLAQLRNVASYVLTADELVVSLKDAAGSMRLRAAPAEAEPAEAGPAAVATAAPSAAPAVPTAPPTAADLAAAATNPPPAEVIGATPPPQPTVAAATLLPGLNGTDWYLVSLTSGASAAPPTGQTPITLQFAGNGSQITGSTGCNEYRAVLARDDGGATVVKGPGLLTQKACPANISVQEVEFMDALLRARSYIVQGNELTLIDALGNPLLVFVRK